MVAYIYNSSTGEAEEGGLLEVSLVTCYIVRLYGNKKKKRDDVKKNTRPFEFIYDALFMYTYAHLSRLYTDN